MVCTNASAGQCNIKVLFPASSTTQPCTACVCVSCFCDLQFEVHDILMWLKVRKPVQESVTDAQLPNIKVSSHVCLNNYAYLLVIAVTQFCNNNESFAALESHSQAKA